MAKDTKQQQETPTVKVMRFQVLKGAHIHGYCRIDPETGKATPVTETEFELDRANCRPAQYYKGGPLGDIVETTVNLLKFNSPGSIKFKLLAPGETPVPEVDDGLEDLTEPQLREHAATLDIHLGNGRLTKAEIITIIRREVSMLTSV